MTSFKQRVALELQVAHVTARMAALNHRYSPENIPEWVALHEVREGLEMLLASSSANRSERPIDSAGEHGILAFLGIFGLTGIVGIEQDAS